MVQDSQTLPTVFVVEDDALLRAARKIALDRDTSVNNLIREYLESLVSASSEQDAALMQVEEFFRAKPYAMGQKNWTRADLHER